MTAALQQGQGPLQQQRPQALQVLWVLRALLLLPLLRCCHLLLHGFGQSQQVLHAPWQVETGVSCAFCQERLC